MRRALRHSVCDLQLGVHRHRRSQTLGRRAFEPRIHVLVLGRVLVNLKVVEMRSTKLPPNVFLFLVEGTMAKE
jgi:hypothetical protein